MVLVCPHLGNEKAWNTEPTQREWSLVGRGKKGGGQTMNCGGKIVDPMVGKLGNSDRMATVFSMKYQK